ncbi:MAG: YcgN family cysteine cluster protein [Alphaproteobacteria bacterium]|nr:YcgN family cysteine cluster protein [Alphaproteobacteria bacterium]
MADRFWETKRLDEMTDAEWEALCDGCGKCCLVLLRDEEDRVWETDVACRLFDRETRRCSDYANRVRRVSDCVRLTPANAGELNWMPETCAYRLLANGEKLFDWHPLITGDPKSAARAGKATSKSVTLEDDVDEDELDDRIVRERRTSR